MSIPPLPLPTENPTECALTDGEILEYAERGLDELRAEIEDVDLLLRIESVRDRLRATFQTHAH